MRLETGVFTPDGDWPGVFIRGDNALMGFRPAVARAAKVLEERGGIEDITCIAFLKRLEQLFGSCDAAAHNPHGNAITVTGTQVQTP